LRESSRRHEESEKAHSKIKVFKGELHSRILQEMQRSGGLTCEEASIALKMKYPTASARFSELKRDGRIIFTGQKRATTSGVLAKIYKAAK
jgi:hypothetical protein